MPQIVKALISKTNYSAAHAQPEGILTDMSRQNVTVLFTDMVDSTVVATSMSPDDADELRRQHFTLLRRAIASTDGVEVKNLGDGLMVAFQSASAALACATEMQQAIELDNRRRNRSIGLRAGLSGGEVSFEDGDYFGDPVIEAARVCAKCERGQILVTDVVRLTAGRRGSHTFKPRGEARLKGLPYAVNIAEVNWSPMSSGAAIDLPARIALVPRSGFVGRSLELGLLEERRVAIATNGGCDVVLIFGEPGQGKTTLAAAAARYAHDRGALVMFGRADEHLGAPYKLFSEALTHYVKHSSDEQLRNAIAVHAADLVPLVPTIADRLPGGAPSSASDTDSERFLMFAAVVATFAVLSKTQPIVVVLDDLQWADQSSLRMLVHLATSPQPMKVLILGTCRDEVLPSSHPLMEALAALHRQNAVTRVDLPGLSPDEVISLMDTAGQFAGSNAAGFAEEIHRDTDGNAFFVTELLRHLVDSEATPNDPRAGGVASVASAVANAVSTTLPRSIHEVISTRVGRLNEQDEQALRCAAVIGREFDLATLSRLTSDSEDALLDMVDRAAHVGLVREVQDAPGQFRFQHALIQRTIYDALGPTRKAGMHRRVARAIEDGGAGEATARAVELARHWSLTSQRADFAIAVKYLRIAADAALASLAPDVAFRHYSDAIELRGRTEERDDEADLDLQIGLGVAQQKIGYPDYRETFLDASRRAIGIGDTHRLVIAALNNSRGWSSAVGAIDAERVEVLETTLKRVPSNTTDRALILAALCKELSWGTTLERRRTLADEAAAIARDCTDDAIAIRVLNDLALPLSTPHTLTTSLERTAESLRRAERLGDPLLLFFASMWRAQTLHLAGDTAGRDLHTAQAGAAAQRLGEPNLVWSQMHNTAVQAMSDGDVARSDEISTAALTFGMAIGEPDAATYFGIQQMVVCLQRGNMGDLGPLIEDTIATMPELGHAGRAALMLSNLEGARIEAAVQNLEASAAIGFDFGLDNSWLVVVVDHAEVAIECRLAYHARPLRAMLLPFADMMAATGTTSQGPVCQYLAGLASVLSLHDEAERFFAQAEAFNRRTNGSFSAARTALWWGRAAADRGNVAAARDRLTVAQTLALEHGYAMVARRAEAALAALAAPADRAGVER